MRIYVTASFSRREEVVGVTMELIQAGHEVTSSWALDESPSRAFPGNAEDLEINCAKALVNLKEIDRSDMLICLGDKEYVRGGKHFETGYGYAQGVKVYIIGHAELMQHFLPNITILSDIDAFYEEVGQVAAILSDKD